MISFIFTWIWLSTVSPRLSAGYIDIHTHHFRGSLENSNMTSEEYKKMVLEAKEHILEGDIFQIVLSQCFERRTFAGPFEIYRALRVVNPSPYMTHLQVSVTFLKFFFILEFRYICFLFTSKLTADEHYVIFSTRLEVVYLLLQVRKSLRV